MTSTLPPDTVHPSTTRRATWALWGTAAGVAGVLTNIVFSAPVGEELRKAGDASAVVAELDRTTYHLAAVTGFTAVACLLFFAAGLARWGRQQASDSLALRVLPTAVTASAGALLAAYGIKGMLAAYLPGGFNESSYGDGARFTYFLLDDLIGYYSWWGVAIAAGCLAVLAFRERLVPRWVGALGALTLLVPVLFLVGVGFTGFSGVICPVFLVVGATGLSRMRS